MAVYNGARFLRAQLDSILPQLSAGDELIISYDESTDETLGIIREYAEKDSRVRIVFNDKPGVTGNFSNAIAACNGDYIFISDQDDVWTADKIEKLKKCFLEKKPDLIIHNGVHTDADLNPQPQTFFEQYRIGDGKLRNIIKPRYSGCCMAFTSELKEKLLPMPEIHGYDQWIATVAEFLGHIEYVDDVLIYHRLHDCNVTPSSSRPLPVILKMRTRLIVNLVSRIRREKSKRM